MKLSAQDLVDLRNRLHNLDLTQEQHQKIYQANRILYVENLEETRYEAYDDRTGKPLRELYQPSDKSKITVGMGFNMSAPGARAEFQRALPHVPFDQVYDGKRRLTQAEVRALTDVSLNSRVHTLRKIYGAVWDQLAPNERLAIESLCYHGLSLVTSNTRFTQAIKLYYETGETAYLQKAIDEIRHHSNPERHPGIQNRREAEADLLNSTQCPAYRNPRESLAYPVHVPVILGQTVLPRQTDHWPQDAQSAYYIWRTQSDDKVRSDHLMLEGKVFSDDFPPPCGAPGLRYNCRCYKEPLPKNCQVMPVSAAQKSAAWEAMYRAIVQENRRKAEEDRRLTASLMPVGEAWEAYRRIRESPTFCHKMLDRPASF